MDYKVLIDKGKNSRNTMTSGIDLIAPSGKLVHYMNRRVEDSLLGYNTNEDGDYEICFNNRFSMLESKRVFWQFEVSSRNIK